MEKYQQIICRDPHGYDVKTYDATTAHLYLRDIFNPLCLAFAKKMQTIAVGDIDPGLERMMRFPVRYSHESFSVSSSPLSTIPKEQLGFFKESIQARNFRVSVNPRFDATFSLALSKAAETIQYFFEFDERTTMRNYMNDMKGAHPEILDQATHWDRRIHHTVSDGVLSVVQAATLLMTTDTGETDPMAFVTDIVRQGLLERFALKAPLNMIGPMSSQQRYFPFAVIERTPDGKLEFTQQLESVLRDEREAFTKRTEYYSCKRMVEEKLTQAGKGCPAGRQSIDEQTNSPYTGIRVLAETMLPYIWFYYEELKQLGDDHLPPAQNINDF